MAPPFFYSSPSNAKAAKRRTRLIKDLKAATYWPDPEGVLTFVRRYRALPPPFRRRIRHLVRCLLLDVSWDNRAAVLRFVESFTKLDKALGKRP